MAPKKKVTSSGDRSKRSTKKPVTQGQNPQRANRQSVSQARVSSSQTRATGTGARVTTGSNQARVRPMPQGYGQGPLPNPNLRSSLSDRPSKPIGTGGGGVTKPSGTPKMVNANKPGMQKLVRKAAQARKAASGRPLVKPAEAKRLMSQRAPGIRQGAAQLRQQAAGTTSPASQARASAQGQQLRKAAETRRAARAASQRMAKKLAQAAATRTLGTVARRAPLAAVAAEGITARNTADGTLSAAMKRGDYKPKQGPSPKTTQSSFNKKTFDQAFKAARTSGAKEFTWRGKRYNTKIK